MTTFIFEGIDRPGAAELRAALREAHRAHIRSPDAGLRCILGGPLLNEPGGAMIGTLLVFEAGDAASIEAFMRKDPYALGGLFAQTSVRPWMIGLGSIAL